MERLSSTTKALGLVGMLAVLSGYPVPASGEPMPDGSIYTSFCPAPDKECPTCAGPACGTVTGYDEDWSVSSLAQSVFHELETCRLWGNSTQALTAMGDTIEKGGVQTDPQASGLALSASCDKLDDVVTCSLDTVGDSDYPGSVLDRVRLTPDGLSFVMHASQDVYCISFHTGLDSDDHHPGRTSAKIGQWDFDARECLLANSSDVRTATATDCSYQSDQVRALVTKLLDL